MLYQGRRDVTLANGILIDKAIRYSSRHFILSGLAA
jgi:hypothetical protein